MPRQERAERLQRDLEALRNLEQHSAILSVEPDGSPPDRYRLGFSGQGIARVSALNSEVEWADEHTVELRLPFMYPSQAPDIRWITPLFHPNLSYSGFLQLDDIGLPWDETVGLEVLCERLWDVARLAYMNLDKAVNPSARRWIEDEDEVRLPVDPRPLRKIELPGARSNVVGYQRRGEDVVLDGQQPASPADDVLFIDETTAPPGRPAISTDDDDEVLYIGDE